MIYSVSGLIGSGKGTISDYLQTKGFKKVAFADALKDAVAAMYGWPRHMLEGDTEESRAWRERSDDFWSEHLGYSVVPREVLQLFGTEYARHQIHDAFWQLRLFKEIKGDVVIADARFLNELATIKREGGKCVGVWHKPPFWLHAWYKDIDRNLSYYDTSIKEIDLMDRSNRDLVLTIAMEVFGTIGITPPHRSEWEHLLWNQYDVVIHNPKSGLKAFWEELAKVL